ncbi:ATP-dependent protease ATPase subunit HslU [bacterium]|nr:ATP-dependent protease ATPase subunit HslU [bacterium]
MTPRQVVEALDRYIIGQDEAKKAVAIALRNRSRRKFIEDDLRDDVIPKNILMVGPTGVGKTEIARRLAKLVGAPFLKVEATKYTEVGYVGRDVESMIRELAMVGVRMVEKRRIEKVKDVARQTAIKRVAEIILRKSKGKKELLPALIQGLQEGKFAKYLINVEIEEDKPQEIQILSGNSEDIGINVQEIFGGMGLFPKKRVSHKVTVERAIELLTLEESKKLVDSDEVKKEAVELIENEGILFLDEIDKIAGREGGHGPDVSRQGVQRDILPIVEGSSINTKIGIIHTDHILFIAAGAFHETKPSDLIPELQGRFPIRVELQSLKEDDFKRILIEPENSLIRQYRELLATEDVELEFSEDGIAEIARMACYVNEQNENIGARRLHTLLERVLEKISFEAPEMAGQKIVIDAKYVQERLQDIVKSRDLSRYIL